MPNPTLTEAIDRLCRGEALSADEAASCLHELMEGRASDAQAAGLLIAFRSKGETVDEIAGMARAMRELATPVVTAHDDLVDTAGTGGGRPTFNVSTTAAFVAAGAGCRVAKHGNRSATSRSGSADLLEALGVRIDLAPEAVAECIDDTGFGFMFAPAHHQATRFVVPVRKQLAVRTIFNFLGPLTNPAGARRQLIGVSDPAYLERIATAAGRLGAVHALVVSARDGLDEMSTTAPTEVVEVRAGADGAEPHLERYTIEPADVGLEPSAPGELVGGTPEENAQITRAILAGELGPRRDVAVLNAGGAIHVAGRADSLQAGVRAAQAAIDDGRAQQTLERLRARSTQLAPA